MPIQNWGVVISMNNSRPNCECPRWPAEWERHRATWLSWPHNLDTWPGVFDSALLEYQEFAKRIARYEAVNIVAANEVLRHAEKAMRGFSNVSFFDIPTNDAWIRDHGPIFLAPPNHDDAPRSQPTLLDFEYNAWGGKYPPFDDDNRVPLRIAQQIRGHRIAVPSVLEGGAIDGNGRGIVMTTRSCLLNSNRNAGRNEADMENLLRRFLHVEHVLWLAGEIPGDDTDGHIDQIARFVSHDTILYSSNDSIALRSNADRIKEFSEHIGIELNAIKLPMPQSRCFRNMPVPASYANFYILNDAVIVPAFGDDNDETARAIVAAQFPMRETISMNASSLIVGLGAFHCLTQQQPELIN